jgi:FkbM family methyltransferase
MTSIERLLLGIARRYPFYRGRGRLALSTFLRAPGAVPSPTIRVTLQSGEVINVIEDDYIGRMVRFFGDLDPALSGVIRSILRPGDVVLDVGANVGVVTLQAASLVGPSGHVFAFEPLTQLSTLLRNSIAENKFNNITIIECALSDKPGVGRMEVAPTSLGCASLSESGNGQVCEMKRLDDIEFGDETKSPRLLKIDVEGHESRVFAGGERFFRECPPDFVLFESQDRCDFWERPEVVMLRDYGYKFSVIFRSSVAKPVFEDVGPKDKRFRSYDFLATKSAKRP